MAVNQLKAGAALNYVVLGLSNLVGLLYTPYMLRMMGQSEYGLYSLVASVIAYLTIMDFGFGNAIIRYTAKFRAEGKLQEQYSMFGMFLILYSIIGVIAFLVGLGLYFNIDSLFGDTMTDYELGRARILMLIMIVNLAFTFPLGIFGSIVTAYEDFIFQKVVQIVRIILNTAVMICLLRMGYRAVAMVVAQTIFNLGTLLLNYFYCRYKIHIKILFGHFQWGFLKEVAVYSFWIFLNAIMDRIYLEYRTVCIRRYFWYHRSRRVRGRYSIPIDVHVILNCYSRRFFTPCNRNGYYPQNRSGIIRFIHPDR